ncbi:MAG: homocysteine biosynthesis protein, partial [Thermoproteota archaeon]
YSGSGALNPLMNDPDYETIGVGTRIFLGGAQGYILGEGTQHDPQNRMGTVMVRGDCKKMDPEFIRGASFTNYGTTLYVGIGVPIPILNPGLAEKTAIRDEEIYTDILNYGVPRRRRPKVGTVNYSQLKSGEIPLQDKTVKASSLSSLKKARKITEILKKQIEDGEFYLSAPSQRLPSKTKVKPARQTYEVRFVGSIAQPAVTCREDEAISTVAKRIVDRGVNHIVVVDEERNLKGIVTSWDITKAVAEDKGELGEIVVRRVITTTPNESLEAAARKMSRNQVSALPLVDHQGKVVGIVTSENISKLIGGKTT